MDKKIVAQLEKKLKDVEFALNESAIVAITDRRGIIQSVNEKFCETSKYSKEELIGQNQNIVNSGYHPKHFFKLMWKTIGTGNVWRGEIKNRAKDGSIYWVDTTIVPFLDENGKPYQYISIRNDITTRKKYEEYIENMAYYDTLTQLPNRNHLGQWMNQNLGQIGDRFTVLLLDIDQFKAINDNLGHDIGDIVLREVALRLKNCVREQDFIFRQSGDEFIIILERNTKSETVTSIANSILEVVKIPIKLEYKEILEILVTTSIGISNETLQTKQSNGKPFIKTLIKKADTAMYHAKKKGGNQYCFSTPEQTMEMDRNFQIEMELHQALSNNEFHIVYQPLIHLKRNQIIGAEALLRWNNPVLGNVSPGEFIPLLEKSGQIIPVGKWILRTVCSQMKIWQQNKILLQRISINVSPIQFKEENFVQDLKHILNETELDASYLEIEITEGTILEIDNASKTLNALQDLGVKVSIDDFGTGYSSLSYLKQLPIDTLKIDKTFINDLDMDGEIIVNTIINMGKNLRFRVIAEGIETNEQLDYLKQQQCDEGQGYYFSKPVMNDHIPQIYKELNRIKHM